MSISEQQQPIETGFSSKPEASEVMAGLDLWKSGTRHRGLFRHWS